MRRKSLIFALLFSMISLMMFLPGIAAASTVSITSTNVPNIDPNSFSSGKLGSIHIDGITTTAGVPDTVNVELPKGISWSVAGYTNPWNSSLTSGIYSGRNPIIVFPENNQDLTANAITKENYGGVGLLGWSSIVDPVDYTNSLAIYGASAPILRDISLTDSKLTFTFTPMQSGEGSIVINTPVISTSGVVSGDIYATISDSNHIFDSNQVKIAEITK